MLRDTQEVQQSKSIANLQYPENDMHTIFSVSEKSLRIDSLQGHRVINILYRTNFAPHSRSAVVKTQKNQLVQFMQHIISGKQRKELLTYRQSELKKSLKDGKDQERIYSQARETLYTLVHMSCTWVALQVS